MTESTLDLARRRLEELVSFFGVNAEVTVAETDDGIELELVADASGKLIGHRGENLRSIQYLVNLMVQRAGEKRRVFVDIAGYKKARAYQLEKQAREAAERVAETGTEEELAPMNAAERRIVHMVLRDLPAVATESRGEEPRRYIAIVPRPN